MVLKNQNILFFSRTMKPGGTENVVLQLCEIFKPLVNKIVVCSCGGVNVEKLSLMGIKHYEIPDIEEKKPLKIYLVARTLKRIIKEEKITVIHTHHRMAAFYVSLLGLYRKCTFINTSHNIFKNKKKLTQFAYRYANLVACGEMVKKNLVDVFEIPEKQIIVIRNSVKPFVDQIVSDNLIASLHENGCFVIGNVGRLSEQKGMEYFIQAIPQIVVKHPEARFVIAGIGEDEEKLKKLAIDEKIDDKLYFLGYRNDIQNLMSQLDLMVLSSLWEGLPLTPIEAFSSGKTIVATAVDGTVEIIRDHIDGLLVEPGNAEMIAEKVNWIIDHPEEREKMEKNAMKRYANEFSFEKLAKDYKTFYERL